VMQHVMQVCKRELSYLSSFLWRVQYHLTNKTWWDSFNNRVQS